MGNESSTEGGEGGGGGGSGGGVGVGGVPPGGQEGAPPHPEQQQQAQAGGGGGAGAPRSGQLQQTRQPPLPPSGAGGDGGMVPPNHPRAASPSHLAGGGQPQQQQQSQQQQQQQQQHRTQQQSRSQQIRQGMQRGMEKTKFGMEKTKTMLKRSSGGGGTPRGSQHGQRQQQHQHQQHQHFGESSNSAAVENGDYARTALHQQPSPSLGPYGSYHGSHGHPQQQQMQQQQQLQQQQQQQLQQQQHQHYHHQQWAEQQRQGYDPRYAQQHHHQQQQHYQQQQQHQHQHAANNRHSQFYHPQQQGGGGGGYGHSHPQQGGGRPSPPATALVDVMYATESHSSRQLSASPLASASEAASAALAGWASSAEAGAARAADTAAAFAASLSSQMGQLSLSNLQGGAYGANAGVPPPPPPHQQHPGHQHPGLDGMHGGSGKFKTTGMSNDEDEWKNAWDEDEESDGGEGDDDDEDDEDDEDDVMGHLGGSLRVPPPGGPKSASRPPVPPGGGGGVGVPPLGPGRAQPFRPAMDAGHSSSSSPLKRPPGLPGAPPPGAPPPSAAAAAAAAAAMREGQYAPYGHGASVPPPPGGTSPAVPFPGYPGAPPPLLSSSSSQRPAVVTALPPETEEDVLTREADKILAKGDNGVQWDTSAALGGGTAPMAVDEDEKPSVRMFFPLLRVLGKGSFGKVVLVQKRTGKERGGLFAMKILRKAHLVKRRQIERTKTERKVLSIVDHPFIMKLHYAFQTDDKLYLVLDYCPGGELFFHLSRFRRFPERVARFFAAELLLAIGHLHKKGIIYRDLKPENVLLDADGHVKLGDFGLAKDKISNPCVGATSMCGTPEYMAPEVLSQAGHGFCVDYWGLGMLTYEMMTGLPPWYTTDRTKLFRRLKSAPLDIPSYFSPQSASFVSALLERNPRKRLGVQGIKSAMAQEFFCDVNWRALRDRHVDAPIRPCEGWKAPELEQNDGGAGGGGGVTQSGNNAQSQKQISQNELDVATANFDATFTRMAVDTEDAGTGGGGGGEPGHSGDEGAGGTKGGGSEELHEHTFVGFTFDEKNPDATSARHSGKGAEHARHRGGGAPSRRN